MQRTGKTLHELKSGMTKYPQVLINVKTEKRVNLKEVDGIQVLVEDVEQALGNQGRVLLRASGTEPLVRVMVEGSNDYQVNQLAQQLANNVKAALLP
jgi:phosphoglucosamine mutase